MNQPVFRAEKPADEPVVGSRERTYVIDGVVQLELPRNDAVASPGGMLPTFVAGPENALAVAPLERLLRSRNLAEAARIFNPLVLVGPAGSGKSQLAQAVVRHWSAELGPDQAAYFTAADFGRELQSALAERRLAAWRSGVRSRRLLVLEDIDRLRLHPAIQQELRATIDAGVEAGAVFVVTSTCEPASLKHFDAGLVDRLVAGLTVRLQRPGLAARRSIVRLAATTRRLPLTAEQIEQLACREVASPAELVGRVAAHQAHGVTDGGRDRVRAASGDCGAAQANFTGDAALLRPTLKQIIAVTARYFGISQAALAGPSRRSSLVLARNIVVHLARQLTNLSYADIGRGLGGRDHTTTMHGQRRLAELLSREPDVQRIVEELDRLLR
ncbi:MAG: hypothetical protein DCC67_05320 [Planctomycetota bacterium]|nr:MAG: hypothetical protein DCC67_05320 [Planctomycetota bacterium]